MKRSATIPLTQQTTITRSGTVRSYGSKRSRASSKGRKAQGSDVLAKFTGFGFPLKLQVRHKYVEQNGIGTSAGAGLGTYQFRANGMYDPNHTGTGHQPLYFDQVNAVYDHFTVLRSYLKLTLTTVSAQPQRVAVFLNDDTTVTPSSMYNIEEQSSCKKCIVSNAQSAQVLYLAFDAQKTFGGNVLSNDNLQGSGSADPVEQTIFTIAAQAVDATQATDVMFVAEIVYTAIWDELKDIPSS